MITVSELDRMLNIRGTKLRKTNALSSPRVLSGRKDTDRDEHEPVWREPGAGKVGRGQRGRALNRGGRRAPTLPPAAAGVSGEQAWKWEGPCVGGVGQMGTSHHGCRGRHF